MYVSTPLAATFQLRVTSPLTTCLLKSLLFKLSTVKFVSGVVLQRTKLYYYGLRPSSWTRLHTFRKLDVSVVRFVEPVTNTGEPRQRSR
jgi:hypothetical protein